MLMWSFSKGLIKAKDVVDRAGTNRQTWVFILNLSWQLRSQRLVNFNTCLTASCIKSRRSDTKETELGFRERTCPWWHQHIWMQSKMPRQMYLSDGLKRLVNISANATRIFQYYELNCGCSSAGMLWTYISDHVLHVTFAGTPRRMIYLWQFSLTNQQSIAYIKGLGHLTTLLQQQQNYSGYQIFPV